MTYEWKDTIITVNGEAARTTVDGTPVAVQVCVLRPMTTREKVCDCVIGGLCITTTGLIVALIRLL